MINRDEVNFWGVNARIQPLQAIVAIEGLFSISFDDALEYAGEWFEEKYGYIVEEILNWDL